MRKTAFPVLALMIFILTLASSGCDPYRKLAKSDNIADKDSAAVQYYKHKRYDRAVYLFEALIPLYRGTKRMEEMYYYYAYSKYFLGELVSASYFFGDFSKKFPTSKHSEEFEYMTAKCMYLLSDPYQLDQKYTYKAIDEYQLFLSRHPYSDKKDKCMAAIKKLRERLAFKAFEQAKLYYNIGYHKAGVKAFQVMINEFPDSDLREEAQFLLFKSSASLAQESIASKKLNRYRESLKFYEKFEEKFPGSKFAKEAESLRDVSEKNLEKLDAQASRREEEKLFRSFKTSISTVLKTEDVEKRRNEYAKALDTYRELQDRFPESSRLSEADKLFKQVEEKQEKEN